MDFFPPISGWEFNVKSEKERVRRYREYVYETGAINHIPIPIQALPLLAASMIPRSTLKVHLRRHLLTAAVSSRMENGKKEI
jgi:hypothetical protein